MARKRRSFSPQFKAKVALEAVKNLRTVGELAQRYKVHPTQVSLWKRQLLEGAEGVFEGGKQGQVKEDEPNVAELYEQIGRLNIQLEWLKKKATQDG